MKTAIYYFDKDISRYRGWKEGLEDCGFSTVAVSKNYGNMPRSVNKVDLWIVENPDETDIQWFSGDNWDGKLVCIVNEYKELYKNFPRVDLWIERCFYDKVTEEQFSGFPFHYCPEATQESLVPFYTELNRPFDVSIDEKQDVKLGDVGFNTVEIPEFSSFKPEEFYGQTKVNYNHIPVGINCVYLNQKAFDIPMSGNFELCNIPQVMDIFEGKVGYTSVDQRIDKIKYYIDHEEERTRMAIKAYEVVIAKHTYTYRMRDMLKKLQLL